MVFCKQCGAVLAGATACPTCGAAQPTAEMAALTAAPSHSTLPRWTFAGLAALAILAVAVVAMHTVSAAKQKAADVTTSLNAMPATVVPALETAGGSATDTINAGADQFSPWHSSTASTSAALPRIGMLVVTAIAEPDGDYESFKEIREISTKGITLSYHAAKTKDGSQEIADLTRVVLTQDLETAHNYAQLFGKNQPQSLPGTTAISVSKEVFAELLQKGSSEFTFQPEGIKGAIGNMMNVLGGFGGVQVKDAEGQAELEKLSKESCTLKRDGVALVAFPVLLNDQPTTLPALPAACTTDDGPAKFYILDQPDYPLLLAWKLGSGSQLQVTKISYPSAPAKETTAAASTHIEQQLEENKKVDIYGIYFDFGDDRLKPESTPVLAEIAAVLAAHPDWKLDVDGHTDNLGGDDYNLDLSRRRAAAVKAFLTKTYRIPPSRLETNGFGASRPVDTNATIAGRARNRRVELVRE